ncbi:MAG: hypothetical protein HQL70_01850 [Magnetococcales bacterium]|nr:hypothetical protein [Magnetococcales bacterium]
MAKDRFDNDSPTTQSRQESDDLQNIATLKGVDISLGFGRRPSPDQFEETQVSVKLYESAGKLAARAEKKVITDPWKIKDGSDKSPISRLKSLASEISKEESTRPKSISPLESFIQSKSSKKPSAVNGGSAENVVVARVAANSEQLKKQGVPDTFAAGDNIKQPQLSKQMVTSEHKKPVRVPTSGNAKAAPHRQEVYKPSVGLPFAPLSESKIITTTTTRSKTEPAPIKNLAASGAVSIISRSRVVKSSSGSGRTTIKRKQMMNQPTILHAIFTNKGHDQLPVTPTKKVAEVSASKGADVVASEDSAGLFTQLKQVKKAQISRKSVIKNSQFVPVSQDSPDSGDIHEDVEVSRPSTVDKIVTLAEKAVDRQQNDLNSSTFKPVYSGAEAVPMGSSKTLFSISKPETEAQSLQPDFGAISTQKSEERPSYEFTMTASMARTRNAAGEEEQYWSVPVETLGSGVANMLGNAVGGVVHVSQVITGGTKRKVTSKPKAKPQAAKSVNVVNVPLKRGQRVKKAMANKIGSGIGGIFSGVGEVAKGGANIVVGTLGCIGGALVCVTGAKVGADNRAQKKELLK